MTSRAWLMMALLWAGLAAPWSPMSIPGAFPGAFSEAFAGSIEGSASLANNTGAMRVEKGVERPGAAFEILKIDPPDAATCEAACAGNPRCVAFTYVDPSSSGHDKGRCWLRDSLTPGWTSSCCTSGVKLDGLKATAAGSAGGPVTYQEADFAPPSEPGDPSLKDGAPLGLDLCLSAGLDCGLPAAQAVCAAKGHGQAVDYTVARHAPPTRTQTDGSLCTGRFCHRLHTVTCR